MITFTEFLDKWNGKFCEMGGSANAKNQCVDLANAYIVEVLGLPIVLGTNAVDFPKKCLAPNYEYILNTPTGVPQQGDIIVWKSPDGLGHIGICSSATSSKFVSFDQNWPVGSVCKLVNHTYTGTYTVIGWLRGKVKSTENIYKGLDLTNKDSMKVAVDAWSDLTSGKLKTISEYESLQTQMRDKDKQIQTLQEKVLSLDKFVKDLQDRVMALESEIKANLDLVTDWQSKYQTANKQLENKNKEIDDITTSKNQYKKYYEAKCDELKKLDKMTAWQHIKYGIKLLSVKK